MPYGGGQKEWEYQVGRCFSIFVADLTAEMMVWPAAYEDTGV